VFKLQNDRRGEGRVTKKKGGKGKKGRREE